MTTSAEPSAERDDPAANMGARLRRARLDAGMTLRELARKLSVSPSFLSQLENGKSQPSVATLYSLAQVLGVSIDRLFEAQDVAVPSVAAKAPGKPVRQGRPKQPHAEAPAPVGEPSTVSRAQPGSLGAPWGEGGRARLSVTRPGERTRLVMDCDVVWEQLARNTDPHLDFMEIIYPPGSSSTTDDRMMRHDGYEYGYLLEGELQVRFGFEEFTLRAGQAMGLDSSVPHLFKNVGKVPARGIWFVQHRQG